MFARPASRWKLSSAGHTPAGPNRAKSTRISAAARRRHDSSQRVGSSTPAALVLAAHARRHENDLDRDDNVDDAVCRLTASLLDAAQTPKTGPAGRQDRPLGGQCSAW